MTTTQVAGAVAVIVDADLGPLQSAVSRAGSVMGGLGGATDKVKAQMDRLARTSTEVQNRIQRLTGVTNSLGKAAAESASAFRNFDRMKSNIDAMRASYDPLFAASKRYEAAVEQLDEALGAGVITQSQYNSMLQQTADAHLTAGNRVAGMAGQLGQVRRAAGGTGIQNLGFQIQDFAVQVGAGTSATQALGQQLPQLLSGFGTLGVLLGTGAAIAVPLFAVAISKLGGNVKTTKDAVEELTQAVSAAKAANEAAQAPIDQLTEKYGAMAGAARAALESIAEGETQAAVASLNETAKSLALSITGVSLSMANYQDILGQGTVASLRLAESMGISRDAAEGLVDKFLALENARGPQAIAAAAADLRDGLLAAGVAANNDLVMALNKATEQAILLSNSAPSANWMDGAITSTQRLIGKLMEAKAKRDSLMQQGGAVGDVTGLGSRRNQTVIAEAAASYGGGGGGGGGGSSAGSELESLQKSLMSQEELQLAAFARQQEALKTALDQRLLTTQQYNDLLEKAQAQHAEKMAGIDAFRYGDGLQKAGAFFGGMAKALQSGNEKMAAISKKFAAAEALTNAWRAFSQAIADPSVPFWGKLAAGASVLSAGMGAVNAIKSGSSSASAARTSRASATASASQAPLQTVNITMTNDPFGISDGIVRQLAKALNGNARNGGVLVNVT